LIVFAAICFAGLLSATGMMEFANTVGGLVVVAAFILGVPWLAWCFYKARRFEAREARRAERNGYNVEDGGNEVTRWSQ
jgi:hypothetical protein